MCATGQSREMVEHYARQVNQKKLAAAAILKWEAAEAKRGAQRKNRKKAPQRKKEAPGLYNRPPEFVQQAAAEPVQPIENIGAPDRMKLRTPMSLKSRSNFADGLEWTGDTRFRRFKSVPN